MENNTLFIQLKPDYTSTAESLGYNTETEYVNEDAVLFQQGVNMDELEILPGETFKISEKFESGTIKCNAVKYKLIKIHMFSGEKETLEGRSSLVLEPGKYLYRSDGNTIEQLESDFDDLGDYSL